MMRLKKVELKKVSANEYTTMKPERKFQEMRRERTKRVAAQVIKP